MLKQYFLQAWAQLRQQPIISAVTIYVCQTFSKPVSLPGKAATGVEVFCQGVRTHFRAPLAGTSSRGMEALSHFSILLLVDFLFLVLLKT